MEPKWTSKALSDLARLYEFLAPVNKSAAARAMQVLTQAPTILLANPRIGERLFQFERREVRRILVGEYEVRYEIQDSIIYVLRLWHTRVLTQKMGEHIKLQRSRQRFSTTSCPP